MQDFYPSRCESYSQRIPRLDPVIYSNSLCKRPLNNQQLQSYEQNGYLIIDDFFKLEEVKSLQNEMNDLLNNDFIKNSEETITEPESREVRSIFRIHQINKKMKELTQNRRILDIIEYILDDEVYIHQSRLNFKPGIHGKEFYWHSDFETWHTEDGMPRMRALSLSIALSDNYEYNGPLMVLPGSHKEFITCVGQTPDEHYKESLKKQVIGVPEQKDLDYLVHKYGIQTFTGRPGSVIFFDCNLMHGSNGNITPYPRSNIFFVFNAKSNALVNPFGHSRPRPNYIAHRQIS